jgi:hypothetical protein
MPDNAMNPSPYSKLLGAVRTIRTSADYRRRQLSYLKEEKPGNYVQEFLLS